MDYISASVFFSQSEKVIENLKEWWMKNKKANDLYFEPKVDWETNEVVLSQLHHADYYIVPVNQVRCIGGFPAFREGQLRKYIEEKTNGVIIKIELVMKHLYDIEIHGHDGGVVIFQFRASDILDLYWQVACKIASETEPS